MNAAAAIVQKVAVRPARHAKPHTVGRTINILAFESGCTHTKEPGGTHQIRLRQVNKPLLPAALGTPRLAFEPDFLRHPAPLRIIIMCDTTCNASSFVIYFLLSIGEGAMSRVSDIVCQRELFRVEEYHSVAEVARKMADLHVGAILVFNGDQLARHFQRARSHEARSGGALRSRTHRRRPGHEHRGGDDRRIGQPGRGDGSHAVPQLPAFAGHARMVWWWPFCPCAI